MHAQARGSGAPSRLPSAPLRPALPEGPRRARETSTATPAHYNSRRPFRPRAGNGPGPRRPQTRAPRREEPRGAAPLQPRSLGCFPARYRFQSARVSSGGRAAASRAMALPRPRWRHFRRRRAHAPSRPGCRAALWGGAPATPPPCGRRPRWGQGLASCAPSGGRERIRPRGRPQRAARHTGSGGAGETGGRRSRDARGGLPGGSRGRGGGGGGGAGAGSGQGRAGDAPPGSATGSAAPALTSSRADGGLLPSRSEPEHVVRPDPSDRGLCTSIPPPPPGSPAAPQSRPTAESRCCAPPEKAPLAAKLQFIRGCNEYKGRLGPGRASVGVHKQDNALRR